MNFDEEIVRLLRLYLSGGSTEEEQIKLEQWCAKADENRLFFEEVVQERVLSEQFLRYRQIDEKEAFRKFERRVKGRMFLPRRIWRVASVVVLAVGITVFGYMKLLKEQALPVAINQEAIHPGSYKATLVLSSGERIPLHETNENKIIVEKGGVATDSNHRLVYNTVKKDKKEEEVFNQLEIPRGGEYKLVLSDGTTVYLNSATSIKYPVRFTGCERKVWLSGEAYFEVTKDPSRPFLVETENAEIKVLGTSFNVNTFHPAETQTVLVEGSVHVRLPNTKMIVTLQPGELAVSDKSSGIEVRKVDTGLYTDWRYGLFRFENQRLEDIMNTLSKWYDVEVFYQSQKVKELHFSGFMERYEQINIILDAINEATGVVFTIKEKTIIISE